MEIRREIESLAIWYIPAFIISVLISSLFTGYMKEFIEFGETTPGMTMSLLSTVSVLINLIDNFVVGIWLYKRGKKDAGRVLLWLLFGIVAHFYAAIIYIGLKIYEQQNAYNNSLNQIGAKDAPPD